MSDSTQPVKPKGAGPGRTSTSCSECQRRKQKCDKQWPCRHCQDRRVPHLCQFKRQRGNSEDDEANAILHRPLPRSTTPPKRKFDEFAPGSAEAAEYAKRVLHTEDDLWSLGYVKAGRPAPFQDLLDAPSWTFTTKALSGHDERMPQIPNDPLPPKPYADVLVHNFCDNINFVYCIVHPTSLLEAYDNWWLTRRTQPNIELESLLLRICAISAQFLPEPICERLECELSEDLGQLKQRWHESAERLSCQVRPGMGGTYQVQQLFLTSSYYKTEAMFVESWHALSNAIRMAQEIGMHKDSPDPTITEFDREVRRSVWMSLYTWDRLMAFVFDRPCMISRAHCKLVEPKLELYKDPIDPDLPSPLLGRVYEFRLTQLLDKHLDTDLSTADLKTIMKPLQDVKVWLDNLPALFRVKDPDTSFDSRHRRIRMARLSLHTSAYITLFHILQPCLVDSSFPRGASDIEKEKLRSACMEYTIRMTDVVDRLASAASHSRFHMSFCLFESVATVCGALVKDRAQKLPKREGVLRALGRAIDILDRLGPTTAVARSSSRILLSLLTKLKAEQPDTAQFIEAGRGKPLFDDDSSTTSACTKTDSGVGSSIASPSSGSDCQKPTPEELPDPFTPGDVDFFSNLDFNLLDSVWDWDTFEFPIDANNAILVPHPEVH